jgi:hypothetical protein
VAQLVKRGASTPQVPGSNPGQSNFVKVFFSAFFQHRPDNSTNQNTVANETFAVANETFRYVSCTRECLIETREHARIFTEFRPIGSRHSYLRYNIEDLFLKTSYTCQGRRKGNHFWHVGHISSTGNYIRKLPLVKTECDHLRQLLFISISFWGTRHR